MPKRHSTRLSFVLEGSKSDGGLVRASDFADWLDGVLLCLRRLEGAATSRVETVYRIAGLSTGSAVLELEVASEADEHELATTITGDFLKGMEGLQAGRIASLPFDSDTKAAFAKLARPLRRQLRRVTVRSAGRQIAIRPDDVVSVLYEPKIEAVSVGAHSGFVDAVNVHRDPLFYLYPTTGPRIACQFDPQLLLESVRSAIKRYVTVYGLAEYAADDPYPSRIVIDRIEINPPEHELTTLAALFGSVPDLTGGVDSVTFVRRQRDAEA